MVLRLVIAVFLLLPAAAVAQPSEGGDIYIYPDDPYNGNPDPYTGLVYSPPSAPGLPQVKYLKIEAPRSLQEKIDELLHGVKVDIPPEYDHFGYEIRRYMAHIGATEIYSDTARREQELKNVRTAKIIFEYWVKDMQSKMATVTDTIESTNASSSLRSSYRYNSGVVSAFRSECQAWLDSNEALLEFLSENETSFLFQNPYMKFRDSGSRATFITLLRARDQARKEINKYPPFGMMVY